MAVTKKQAIVETALELFVSKGIDATSIRSIAEGADTAEGNIYRHFKSKNDLARTIFLNCATQFRNTLKEKVASEKSPEQQIEILVRTIFEFAFNHEREFSYLLIANHREEIITKEMLSKPLPKDIFIDILQDGQEQGVFQSLEDPTIVVAWLIGMVQRSIIFTQRNMISLKPEQVIEETVQAVLRMLKS
ncbi:TetR/AcrR family transcriptional regulator [Fodinibius sp.]|uniref:TetR/AcrR family transcriptional regulator n=1 Tax=Fodinibius sp. TaxID=1872440 RepID=UPI002ACDEA4D|nr:TetR/AcrR family transcriptional regulator [Fodinibius sp.]MDZ7657692.1 TetR/AcrR family transcriptional regulator [Fodinibius sp.]